MGEVLGFAVHFGFILLWCWAWLMVFRGVVRWVLGDRKCSAHRCGCCADMGRVQHRGRASDPHSR